MATDIVHRSNFIGFGARDDDGVFAYLNQLIIADRRDLANMQRIDPALENEVLELLLMNQM